MATKNNQKIRDMVELLALTGKEMLPLAREGKNYKVTTKTLSEYIGSTGGGSLPTDVAAQIKQNTENIEIIQNNITSLSNQLDNNKEEIDDLGQLVNVQKTDIQNNSNRLDSIEDNILDISGDIEGLKSLATTTSSGLMSAQDKMDLNTLMVFYEGTDTDSTINSWKELEKFLEDFDTTKDLADLLTSKADKSTVVEINKRVTDLEDSDFVDIDSLRSTLESYYTKKEVDDLLGEAGGVDLTGYVNEIAASGTGNGIASVSKDGSKLTFTKATFLTSHQSLDGYINNVSDEGSGNVITDYRKSGKSLVLQKGLSVYSKAEVDKLIGDISIPDLDGYVTTKTLTSSLDNLANTYLSFRDGGTVSGATTFSGGLSVQNSLTLLGVNVAAGSSGLTFDGKIPMYSGDAYTKSEADKKFHPLTTVDTTPTINSSNLVTSGGVAKAVADLAESADRLYQRKGSYLTASSSLSSANLDKNTINIASTSVSLGGSITQNQLITNLGLKGLAFKDSIDLSGYLPLSGGVMTGDISYGTDSHGIYFYGDCGIEKWSGYGPSLVAEGDNTDFWIRNRVDRATRYKILHEGNISSYAITSATLNDFPRLNGTSPSGAAATGTWGIDISGSAAKLGGWADNTYFAYRGWDDSPGKNANEATMGCAFTYANNAPYSGPLLTFSCGGYDIQLNSDYYSANKLSYRVRNGDHGNWNDWKTIAFTDSTVAAAKTLVNDSETKSISVDNKGQLKVIGWGIGDNASKWQICTAGYIGNTSDSLSDGLELKSNNGIVLASYYIGLILNSSGNVTIGSSDLAGTDWKAYINGSTRIANVTIASGVLNANRHVNTGALFDSSKMGFEIEPCASDVTLKGYDTSGKGVVNINLASSGNVGIGTTNPNTKLHVAGSAKIEGALSTYGITATTTAATDAAFTHYAGSTKLWWVSSYNNCANFNTALYVQSGSSPIKVATVNDLSSYLPKAGGKISGSLTFSSTSVSHIIGNSTQGISFKTTSNSDTTLYFEQQSANSYSIRSDDEAAYWNLGDDLNRFNVLYCRSVSQSSDATLKNILGNIGLNTSQIANAPAVHFTWKNGGAKDVGTIAQYWKNVLPEVVSGEEGSYGMNYAVLGVVSSIILARNIETHEQRIARLEKEISDLQKELNALVNNE